MRNKEMRIISGVTIDLGLYTVFLPAYLPQNGLIRTNATKTLSSRLMKLLCTIRRETAKTTAIYTIDKRTTKSCPSLLLSLTMLINIRMPPQTIEPKKVK